MRFWVLPQAGQVAWFAFCLLQSVVSLTASSLQDEYRITTWETDDGLPENSATSMVQTPDGFLWIGTFNGLVRFDGVKFVVFDPSNTPELPNASIIDLHLHQSSRLWISTYKGLVTLKDGQWKRAGLNTSWTNRYVRTFAENASGVLCATSFDGAICRLDGDDVRELPPPASTRGQRAYVDPAGDIWALSDHFFGRWDGQRWVLSDIAATVTNEFRSSTTARDGGLWVVANSRLLKLEAEKVVSSVELDQPLTEAWSLFEDEDGSLWMTSYQVGLFHVSRTGKVDQFKMKDGLSYDALRFAFRDREHNFWIGTSGGGLMRLRQRTFRTLNTESSLPIRVTKSVCAENQRAMLLGTYGGGVLRLDATTGSTARLMPTLVTGYVHCVLVDRQQRIWAGTFGQGLVTHADSEERQIAWEESGGNKITALFEDSKGRIWIGGNVSTALFEAGRFRRVSQADGRLVSQVSSFAENPADGSIWCANSLGVFRFSNAGLEEIKKPDGKSLGDLSYLHFATDGTLWAGSGNSGLIRFRGRETASITVRHGLPTDSISSILDDGLGNFWFGSNRGVLRAPKAACEAVMDGKNAVLDCQVFTVSDGLASVECPSGYQPTSTKDGQGRLWFATMKGVAWVDPRQFRLDTNPPPVRIESASCLTPDNVRQVLDFTKHLPPLNAPPGSTQFEVNYTALNFSDPAKVRFRHRLLKGSQVLEQTETTRQSARNAVLPPGRYTFQVWAANHHGFWSPAPATISFTVLPYYWQTLWFRGLALLLSLGGVGGAVWRHQHNKLRRQKEQLAHERILAREQARLASVLESTSDFVGFASPNGSVLHINAAGRRMTGLEEKEDVTRLHLNDFHPPATADYIFQKVIPHAVQNGTWSGETVLKRRDGREIPVSQVLVTHKDATGQLLFLSTIIRDISEQRRAQEILQASESALRAFLDALPTPAFLLDKDGKLLVLNEALAHSFGQSREELVGKVGYAFLPPELAASRKAAIDRVFATGQEISFEDFNHGRHYINYLSPVLGPNGVVARVAIFALDITSRKHAEEKIHQQLEELRRWHEATLGREERALELKREVNELLRRLNEPPRYASAVPPA